MHRAKVVSINVSMSDGSFYCMEGSMAELLDGDTDLLKVGDAIGWSRINPPRQCQSTRPISKISRDTYRFTVCQQMQDHEGNHGDGKIEW